MFNRFKDGRAFIALGVPNDWGASALAIE